MTDQQKPAFPRSGKSISHDELCELTEGTIPDRPVIAVAASHFVSAWVGRVHYNLIFQREGSPCARRWKRLN